MQAGGMGSALLCSSRVALVHLLFSSCSARLIPAGPWEHPSGAIERPPVFDCLGLAGIHLRLIWRYGHSENHRNQTRNRRRRNAEFHCCGLKTGRHQHRFSNFRHAAHICRRQMVRAGLDWRSSGSSFRHRSRGTTRPHCRACHRGPRDWGSSAQPDGSFERHFL